MASFLLVNCKSIKGYTYTYECGREWNLQDHIEQSQEEVKYFDELMN